MVTKSDRWVSLCTLVSTNVDHIHEHKHKCNTQIVEKSACPDYQMVIQLNFKLKQLTHDNYKTDLRYQCVN